MLRGLILAAGVCGALAVALGAFGAHALTDRLDARQLDLWETASHYHLVHSVVLAIGALRAGSGARWGAASAFAMVIGILVFSGSLYAMALGAPRWFGAITPLGGLSFIVGWLLLAASAWGPRPSSTEGAP